MCGIAGMIDLSGRRRAPRGIVPKMAAAIYHRGPDEDGEYDNDGLHLANRRLSIVGLADGKQPISNEDGTVWTVFNGEFFDYPEQKQQLQAKGHTFRTTTDTELIPHLWEDHREQFVEKLKGQYAICVYDSKTREVLLARDRTGICPLFYAPVRHDGTDWLLFGSEIKAILASGLVDPKPDPRGLNHIFTFFAMPGPMTVFQGVSVLLPGRYLHFKLGDGTRVEDATKQKIYWQVSYPDQGQEDYGSDERKTVDRFEELLLAGVQKRLRADVPVVSYLSGGVDSSLVVAMSNKALGRPIPTFTISIGGDPRLNEESVALSVAKQLGCEPLVVPCGPDELRAGYPELITAAECPVIDTSCLGLMHLARAVHRAGYKVALTGEGADEWMAGYPWFKIHRALATVDVGGLPVSQWLRRAFVSVTGMPKYPQDAVRKLHALVGGHNGWLDVYGMMSLNKLRFFGDGLRPVLEHSAYDDLDLNPDLHRWHPFHREMYLGARVMLPGHLMASKGDRVAMHSSVECRYPFLDEDLLQYISTLHPRWKLRGYLKDKFIERKAAERWLPAEVANRRKHMFRAPMDTFGAQSAERGAGSESRADAWVDQVLSPESLRKTGYFDIDAVQQARQKMARKKKTVGQTGLEMGLTAVAATQLWHHLYISGGLADIPTATATPQPAGAA